MTFRNSGRRYRAARQVARMRNYTTSYEPILSRILKPNNRDFLIFNCDTSLCFLRHDELQIQALGTVGVLTIRADGLRTRGDMDCWGTGKLQAFNQPTGQSVSGPDFQTQHALANRSGISASLMTTGRRKQRYYYSRPPELDYHKSQRYQPSLIARAF